MKHDNSFPKRGENPEFAANLLEVYNHKTVVFLKEILIQLVPDCIWQNRSLIFPEIFLALRFVAIVEKDRSVLLGCS